MGTLGSCGFAGAGLGVVRFIQFRVGSLVRTSWSWGSFGFAWVHWGAPSGRRVNWGSRRFIHIRVSSFVRSQMSSQTFRFAWVHSCAPESRLDPSGSFGFTRVSLVVVGLIRVSVG